MKVSELLKKFNLELDIPQKWYDVEMVGEYEKYYARDINGETVHIFEGKNTISIPTSFNYKYR